MNAKEDDKEDEQRLRKKVRESQEKCQSQYFHQRSAEQSAEVGKTMANLSACAYGTHMAPAGRTKYREMPAGVIGEVVLRPPCW